MLTEYDDTDRRAAASEAHADRIMPRARVERVVDCDDPWCPQAGTAHTTVVKIIK